MKVVASFNTTLDEPLDTLCDEDSVISRSLFSTIDERTFYVIIPQISIPLRFTQDKLEVFSTRQNS